MNSLSRDFRFCCCLRKRVAVCATSTTPLRKLTCHYGITQYYLPLKTVKAKTLAYCGHAMRKLDSEPAWIAAEVYAPVSWSDISLLLTVTVRYSRSSTTLSWFSTVMGHQQRHWSRIWGTFTDKGEGRKVHNGETLCSFSAVMNVGLLVSCLWHWIAGPHGIGHVSEHRARQ